MRLATLKKEYRKINPRVKELVKKDLAFQTGLQIERLRILRGVTQEKLAKMINTQQASISRAEGGRVLQNLGFLQKIAYALDTYVIAPKFAALEKMSLTTLQTFGFIDKNEELTHTAYCTVQPLISERLRIRSSEKMFESIFSDNKADLNNYTEKLDA